MQVSLFFKALSDETRLLLLLLLVKQKELCVCDYTHLLNLSQPMVSRHLAVLRKAQLVCASKRGQWVYYRLHGSLAKWQLQLLEITASQYQTQLAGILEKCDISDQQRCN